MLVVVIVVGLIYALPNLYGEDPAVQITGARGVAASEQTLIQVQKNFTRRKNNREVCGTGRGRYSCALRHH